MEKKPVELFKEKCGCPHCKKRIIVKKVKNVVVEAVAAEYEEKVIVEKDAQKTIKESTKSEKKSKHGKKQSNLPKLQ